MDENEDYVITCQIDNVAPIQNLTVKWYKGDVMVDVRSFENSSPEPVNVTANFTWKPNREEHGTTFWCEAHLDLGSDGPEPVLSQKYQVTVRCKYINCFF